MVSNAEQITHVLLGHAMHDKPQLEKVRMVLLGWAELMSLGEQSKGSRYTLKLSKGRPTLEKGAINK